MPYNCFTRSVTGHEQRDETMSYENAPATKMLATYCAICSRPLVDATSVETGIGPTCREKYGYNVELPEEVRQEANKLVHKIAVDQDGPEVLEACKRLMTLGLTKIVTAVLDRVCAVKIAIHPETGRYGVKAPYSEEAVAILRNVAGRLWDKENKINTYPATSKAALFAAITLAFPGRFAVGPKGPFKIPEQVAKKTALQVAA